MDLERFSGLRFVNFSTGHLSVLIYFLLYGEHFLPVSLGCGGTWGRWMPCAHLALGMGISAHSIGDKLRLKSMKSNILGEMSMFMRKGKANKKERVFCQTSFCVSFASCECCEFPRQGLEMYSN